MSVKIFEKESAGQKFRSELQEVKAQLKTGWRNLFFKHFPQYDNNKGVTHLSNVFHGRSADLRVLDTLKKVIELQTDEELTSDSNEYNETKFENRDK